MLTIEAENSRNLRAFIMTLGSYYTIALYFLFSIVDLIFYKDFFYEFLVVRAIVVGVILATNKALTFTFDASFRIVQSICSIPFVACAISIYYMILRIGDPYTAYWAGLAIVTAGLSVGFTFSWGCYLLNVAIVVAPLVIISLLGYSNNGDVALFLNPIFLLSIGVVCVTGRWFYAKLAGAEYRNRLRLAEEIESRNRIIEEKTQESLRLNALSKQFSPQIVQSIREGKISLASKIHRSEICAIFVDIKDSTIKFSNLEREDLQKIIAMYMEDVMGIFLKYDITIDKFLGDGVMGFTNDPLPQDDYLERALLAAIEIKNKILVKQEVYAQLWKSDFEIRIGLSSGSAAVGFYGCDKHVKSYTAIGRVVNLASRINGVAPANQIAISGEIVEKLQLCKSPFLQNYEIKSLSNCTLKGFESEDLQVHIFDLATAPISVSGNEDCPSGHGPLVISQLDNGIYVMKCRYCEYCLEDSSVLQKVA